MGRGARWQYEVREGAVFRRQSSSGVVETARVIEVAPDTQGIAHVHYDFLVAKNDHRFIDERRTLNLVTFQQAFGQPVES
ncbi:hypothetical protein [Algihabitans albus]|uniref:hypothetical protein n=1 Tax=Algihabitans albus TaxID=2164067 RepID=UPI000E5C8DD3|nr:hypothetical protein [Algihabitans albus]